MVPPWIGYSIWKFWVIRVLVSLVFHVFSTTELILHCKNSEFCRLSFSIIFLHDFILFGIDMHQNRSISLFKTLFDHFHFHPLGALKWYPHLILCPLLSSYTVFLTTLCQQRKLQLHLQCGRCFNAFAHLTRVKNVKTQKISHLLFIRFGLKMLLRWVNSRQHCRLSICLF